MGNNVKDVVEIVVFVLLGQNFDYLQIIQDFNEVEINQVKVVDFKSFFMKMVVVIVVIVVLLKVDI